MVGHKPLDGVRKTDFNSRRSVFPRALRASPERVGFRFSSAPRTLPRARNPLIHTRCEPESRSAEIVLRPNPAWPWRANLLLVGSLALVTVSYGIWFWLRGMTLILPFSMLELLLVAAVLYRIARLAQRQEVLTFREDELIVEFGTRAPERSYRFNRPWTRFEVEPPRYRGHPRRILVCSRGEVLEIGSFLNDDDQTLLVATLREVITRLDTPGGDATSADDPA